ncbi:DUF2971 domain-containing protein [Hyphococcus flavus]|uniref:DUF2971 domain-containing protein n=1 Tax=Hyphococcus flavus TaxID=1866326 RepID=A0AAE9ZBT9_9PROT|nr:DUF2971 domain-containing protein [Hyphococcus flavus]WDI31351.1 DUF2971 domain-containing protein [Hyphococcus flavus]
MIDDPLETARLLIPDEVAIRENISGTAKRFAYYTSAETALRILQNKEIWMRNTACMNDYGEISYGTNLLVRAFNSEAGNSFRAAINELDHTIADKVLNDIDKWLKAFPLTTYVVCVSEHENSENELGRLSMWRAYGGGSGVALIFRGDPFTAETDDLGAYSFPVRYAGEAEVSAQVMSLARRIHDNAKVLANHDKSDIIFYLRTTLISWILCTKHAAFREEREWRVVHSPALGPPEGLDTEIVSVHGIPQRIYKIPLKMTTGEIPIDLSPTAILEGILIGPTYFPMVSYEAFGEVLREIGFENPYERIRLTNIPLRQEA